MLGSRSGISMLGSGEPGGHDSPLISGSEEDDYDALNDETFGGDALNGDWEEDHEKLAEVIELGRGAEFPLSRKEDGSEDRTEKMVAMRRNFDEEEEERRRGSRKEMEEFEDGFIAASIQQLVLDDDLDDPAIMNKKPSMPRPIPFPKDGGSRGLSPPPSGLFGSPHQPSIWAMDQRASPSLSLSSSLDDPCIIKAGTKYPISFPTPSSRAPLSTSLPKVLPNMRTVSEVEREALSPSRQLVHPGFPSQTPKVRTLDDVERSMLERSQGPRPPMPPMVFPPNLPPPPGSLPFLPPRLPPHAISPMRPPHEALMGQGERMESWRMRGYQQQRPLLQLRNGAPWSPHSWKNEHILDHNGDERPEPREKEWDEYKGLMTLKEQTWLVNIQLTQLATNDPYTDDYYINHYVAKRLAEHGNGMEEAVSPSLLSTPEEGKHSDQNRVYTPPKMENSLGRLQVASAMAPRRIIDLATVSSHSQHSLLLEIENYYNALLDLESYDDRLRAIQDGPLRDNIRVQRTEFAEKLTQRFALKSIQSLLLVRKGKNLVLRLAGLLPSSFRRLVLEAFLLGFSPIAKRDSGDKILPRFLIPLKKALLDSTLSQLIALLKAAIDKDHLEDMLMHQLGISLVLLILVTVEDVLKNGSGCPCPTLLADWEVAVGRVAQTIASSASIAQPLDLSVSLAAEVFHRRVAIEKNVLDGVQEKLQKVL